MEALLQEPAAFFGLAPDSPLELNAQGCHDFQEAADSYAAGFILSAMMFLVRAMEDVTRCYYLRVTELGTFRKGGREPGWSTLNVTLSIPALRCHQRITDILIELSKKRNRLMHAVELDPAEWNERQALHLFRQSRKVISYILQDLETRNGGQTSMSDRKVEEKRNDEKE